MPIPLFATGAALDELREETLRQMAAVVESGQYILGPEVRAFEAEFAAFTQTDQCIGVANGTDAITIALRALGLDPGSEVVVPALTFYATAEAVVNAGYRPVFCDVDPATWVMTAETAAPAITERTSCLLPVHLFGNPAPMDDLRRLANRRGLALAEDAAQAAGARYGEAPAGCLADVATFSFYPGKNLGALGDAGAITTMDGEVADRARRLRFHGSVDKVTHTEVGYNSRLDSLQAAALRIRLRRLLEWTEARRAAAAAYAGAGIGDHVQAPAETPGGQSCFHLYVVLSERRDALRDALAEGGVESRPYYTTPMHRQPALAGFAPEEELPNADRVCRQNLALPMGQSLTAEQVAEVVGLVAAVQRS